MSSVTGQPRLDQIAELTRGVAELPLASLPERLLQFIADKVVYAFNDLRSRYPEVFQNGREPEITALMESRLKSLRNEDRRWEMLVSAVVRGWESHSFDGRRLEVRPDLSIVLTDRLRDRFPLRIECKIIDYPAGKTAGDYCLDGVRRYEEGDYAWANREAFMLAYVHDGSDLVTRLACRVSGLACRPGRQDLAVSSHPRRFALPLPFGNPGNIELWHLWLSL